MYQGNINEVVSRSRDGMFIIDQDRRCVAFSEGCQRITGVAADRVMGQQCDCRRTTECEGAHTRSLFEALCPGLEVFSGEISTSRQRIRIKREDGNTVWVEVRYSPMYDSTGQVACVIGVVQDISRANDLEKELRNGGTGPYTVSRLEPLLPEPSLPAVDTAAEPGSSNGDGLLDRVLASVERREILNALRRAHGQRSQAAKALGISRSRLYRRMETLRIDPREDI